MYILNSVEPSSDLDPASTVMYTIQKALHPQKPKPRL